MISFHSRIIIYFKREEGELFILRSKVIILAPQNTFHSSYKGMFFATFWLLLGKSGTWSSWTGQGKKLNELKHMRGYDKAFSIIPHTFVPLPIPRPLAEIKR